MEKWRGFDFALETVTTVTVNNNRQTYLPRNRFSRCSAFCFKQLFCALYLPSADTHAPPPPPLLLHPIHSQNIEQVFAKGAPGHRVRGIGRGEVRGEGEGRKRLSGPFISRSASSFSPPPSPSAHHGALRAQGGGPAPGRSHATSLSL